MSLNPRTRTLVLSVVGLLVVSAVAVGAVVLTGGSDSGKAAPPATTTTVAPTTTTVPIPTAPLTGLPDPGGASLTRPALEVKVENTAFARPQTGIDQADVVYEEVVEGNITRFVTIYNSTVPGVIGPVRSVRAEDPDIVWPLGGIFAYSGGAQINVDSINAAPVHAVDESSAGGAMVRNEPNQPPRDAPHNLYGLGPALFALGGQPVSPKPLFQYAVAGAPVAGTGVLSMHLGPTNVVVQFTPYTGEAEGQTVGEGDVWVFSGGTVRMGRWVRPDKTQPAHYVDASGAPILLNPGRTWVELLPVGSPVDIVPAPVPVTTVPPTTVAPPTTKKKKK
jgi:hypothetical protein